MATDALSNDPIPTLPVELRPSVDNLVTEDDTPVDGTLAEKQMRLLTEPLFTYWSGSKLTRPFVAMANVGLFYSVHQPPLVPDVLVSFDVEQPSDLSQKVNRSYFVWEYGKPPDVVIEVVSNREGGEDSDKLRSYFRIGVRYYVLFDPLHMLSKEELRVFGPGAVGYQRVDEPVYFADTGLGLCVWRGIYEGIEYRWLRWVNADNVLVPTGLERAKTAEARAERLTEQLRQLGVEPQ